METQQRLQWIRSLCVERVEFYSALLENTKGEYRKQIKETIAAMRSTSAAIDAILPRVERYGIHDERTAPLAAAILAAWPEELFK